MIDFNKLKDILQSNHSFLITTHVNPDADAIGSEIALFRILKALGNTARIVNYSETPYNLKFLDTEKTIEKFEEDLHGKLFETSDVLVALDFNRSNRIVSMQESFLNSKKIKICIDHHEDPEDFVDFKFIDSSYAATGHIIYELLIQTKIVKLSESLATPIYAAIMTDTGSFRFERTTPALHRIAGELLDAGINPTKIYNQLYDESKFSKIKLLGKALDSLKLSGKNKIGYMTLTQRDFTDVNGLESDTENFVNFTLAVEGVLVGLLFIELKNGFKVSFRSKNKIPVNKLASSFGGGGHFNAAGARFKDIEMNEMIIKILKETELFINKYSEG